MKRAIKFRAKTSAGSDWLYGGGVVTLPDGKCVMLHLDDDQRVTVTIVLPETVGQYTGLLDGNGVEIYEGDIVEYHSHTKRLGEQYHRRQVTYEAPSFSLRKIGKYDGDPKENERGDIKSKRLEKLKVIGNTTDTPELLK